MNNLESIASIYQYIQGAELMAIGSDYSSSPCRDTYRFYGLTVTLESDTPVVLSFFRSLYSRFLVQDESPGYVIKIVKGGFPYSCLAIISQDMVCLIYKTRSGYWIISKQGDLSRINTLLAGDKPLESVLAETRRDFSEDNPGDREILQAIAQLVLHNYLSRQKHCLFLHAASVSWGNRGILLSGYTGRGKSTLAVELIRQGCSFFSDDVSCVNLPATEILPFPLVLSLREGAVRLFPDVAIAGKGREVSNGQGKKRLLDIEDIFPASIGEPCQPHYYITLTGFADNARLTPAPKREALWEAVRSLHLIIDDPGYSIMELSAVFDRLDCYELVAGDLSQTAELVINLVKSG
ncbi:MAG: hypothetical protein HZA78_12485 [Candidatus Schekmanbacteria bacterium]|nr:hypothetical protein [Candidatus Schekmanbacteria bacterium]